MTAFAIYDDQGNILRTGNCPESDLHLKAKPGEHLYIGLADQRLHKIVDGALVDIEPADDIDLIRQIRLDRNLLLAKTDWTQLPDAPVDKQAWAEYRQALRDLPETGILSADAVQWPQPPEA